MRIAIYGVGGAGGYFGVATPVHKIIDERLLSRVLQSRLATEL